MEERSPAAPRPAATLAHGTAASLWLTLVLAYGMGIRGSALPRLRQGIPLPADPPYVLAVGLAVAALVAAVAATLAPPAQPLVTTLRSSLQEGRRRLAEGAEVFSAEPAAREADASAAAAPSADAETDLPTVTPGLRTVLPRLLSPATLVLTAVSSAAMFGILLVVSLAKLERGTADLLSVLIAFAPAPAMLWALLESLWRHDEKVGPILGSLSRTVLAPLPIAVLALVPSLLASLLPSVWQGCSAQFASAVGEGGMLSASAPPPAHVAAAALVALGIGMVGGLGLSVAVVIPAAAFLMPQTMIAENEMSTSPMDRRRNITAVRLIAVLVLMIFVFAALMTGFTRGDVPGWAPFLAVGVLVVLTGAILRLQRVDHERRARSGTAARFQNPEDPPPS